MSLSTWRPIFDIQLCNFCLDIIVLYYLVLWLKDYVSLFKCPFFTMLMSSHLLSLTSLLLQVFIQFSMNGSREVFSRAILKDSWIIPKIGKGLTTSVSSNDFTSFRCHYLLYRGRRWSMIKTKRRKKNIIRVLLKKERKKGSGFLFKKETFLGTWSLRKKKRKRYTWERLFSMWEEVLISFPVLWVYQETKEFL